MSIEKFNVSRDDSIYEAWTDAGKKEVLIQIGLDFGNCRNPFSVPTEEEKEIIAKEIVPYIFKG